MGTKKQQSLLKVSSLIVVDSFFDGRQHCLESDKFHYLGGDVEAIQEEMV